MAGDSEAATSDEHEPRLIDGQGKSEATLSDQSFIEDAFLKFSEAIREKNENAYFRILVKLLPLIEDLDTQNSILLLTNKHRENALELAVKCNILTPDDWG